MMALLLMAMNYNKEFYFRMISEGLTRVSFYESLIDDDSLVYYLIEMFLPPCYER